MKAIKIIQFFLVSIPLAAVVYVGATAAYSIKGVSIIRLWKWVVIGWGIITIFSS